MPLTTSGSLKTSLAVVCGSEAARDQTEKQKTKRRTNQNSSRKSPSILKKKAIINLGSQYMFEKGSISLYNPDHVGLNLNHSQKGRSYSCLLSLLAIGDSMTFKLHHLALLISVYHRLQRMNCCSFLSWWELLNKESLILQHIIVCEQQGFSFSCFFVLYYAYIQLSRDWLTVIYLYVTGPELLAKVGQIQIECMHWCFYMSNNFFALHSLYWAMQGHVMRHWFLFYLNNLKKITLIALIKHFGAELIGISKFYCQK